MITLAEVLEAREESRKEWDKILTYWGGRDLLPENLFKEWQAQELRLNKLVAKLQAEEDKWADREVAMRGEPDHVRDFNSDTGMEDIDGR